MLHENCIQIWRIEADSLVRECDYRILPWDPVRIEWLSDSVIIFDKMDYDWITYSVRFRPGRLELSSDGTWIPEDPDSWE